MTAAKDTDEPTCGQLSEWAEDPASAPPEHREVVLEIARQNARLKPAIDAWLASMTEFEAARAKAARNRKSAGDVWRWIQHRMEVLEAELDRALAEDAAEGTQTRKRAFLRLFVATEYSAAQPKFNAKKERGGKLPPATDLQAELLALMAARNISRGAAVAVLGKRHNTSARSVNMKLSSGHTKKTGS